VSDRDNLVETITQRVLHALVASSSGSTAPGSTAAPTGDSGRCAAGRCEDCVGTCAARCSDKVRSVLGAGAGRIAFAGAEDGDGSDRDLGGGAVPRDLASFIDHTLLKPAATATQIDTLCDEAKRYAFAAVCVNPVWVKRASTRLRGSGVRVASVIGFPLGASLPEIKVAETRRALRDGAREIDMVINVGALKSGDLTLVERDIAGVSDACREVGAANKVIIEAALLSDEEKVIASQIAKRARAHYVKTSTGFGPGGATVFDVALMREAVGPTLGVKAAGGIKGTEDAEAMIAAGATRIGASAGVAMVTGGRSNESY
jgi:deoxyribose-phosphate aldolase